MLEVYFVAQTPHQGQNTTLGKRRACMQSAAVTSAARRGQRVCSPPAPKIAMKLRRSREPLKAPRQATLPAFTVPSQVRMPRCLCSLNRQVQEVQWLARHGRYTRSHGGVRWNEALHAPSNIMHVASNSQARGAPRRRQTSLPGGDGAQLQL